MNTNNFNSKVFDEVLRIVVRDYQDKEIEEYNNITENEKHTFSPEFEKKMKKILKQGRKFKGDIRKSSLNILKRISIIILVILSVSFLSLFSVKAIREEIYNIVTMFFEKYIDIQFVNMDNVNFVSDLSANIIYETYLPSYIPDGYWEDTIEKSECDVKAIYINTEEENIVYHQQLLSVAISIDGENYIENDININGINGKIYEYNKTDDISYYIIIWSDNKYSYKLRSFLNKEETIKIAESIKLQNIEK